MVKSQVMDCFDSNLQERILRINEKLKSISPDNVRHFDSSIIEVNGKIDALNYFYSGDSMINSVNTNKLNWLLTKSKSRIMKFEAVALTTVKGVDDNGNEIDIPLKEYLQTVHEDLVEIEIDVPESYSGLQSFVVTHPDPNGREYYPVDKKKKFWYYPQERTVKFNFLRYDVFEIYILFWK